VLLLGGTKDDNLFQIPDLKEHLDLLASVGGNYIRNTMSDRVIQGFEIQAFKKLPDGKYDLSQWNDKYWNRFETMLKLTGERDIIVQIEVWDRFDYTDNGRFKTWKPNPYNPANNINYTSAESALEATYPKHHPGADKQPFFHTIPAMDDNKVLRRYQEAFVDKMLSYSLPCGNVLYCMNNETSTPPIWGQYWMKYIRTRAAEAGLDVYLTDMFDVGWELDTEEKFLLSFDRPDIYTFLDISQNTGNKNTFKKHWHNILFVRDRIKKNPRPINNTKNYGSSEWPPNSSYYKRVWRRWTTESTIQRYVLNVIGGCASTRFHRNPIGGIGLRKPAQDCIKAVRKLESLVKMWELTPRNDLLTDYEDSKVFLSADPGRTYALLFLEGGSATVDLKRYEGTFMVKWINVGTAEWGKEDEIEANAIVPITSPGEGVWLAAMIRKQQQTSWSGRRVPGIDGKVSLQKTSGLVLHQVPDNSNDRGRVRSKPKRTIVKIATIGPPPLAIAPGTEAQKAVDRMIAHWKGRFAQVLPDRPDLIVVPEACDRPSGFSGEKRLEYYRVRKDQIQKFFARVARENNCYIVYSAAREMKDGTWRNSSVMLDRNGEVAGIYNKNHVVIEETTKSGILCGREALVIDCDFGRVAFAICFDLNFDELRLKYIKAKPDLLIFSSMYHGGLMQSYWAYSCRCHFVGAVAGLPCEIRNPLGQVTAANTNYFDYAVATVNLDCRLAHLDYNWGRLRALKAKYGPKVTITDPGYLGCVLITSEHETVSADDMVEEFEIELLDDYMTRALAHRHTPGNME